jgi:hypothetical protein
MRFRSIALLLLALAVLGSAVYLRRWPRPTNEVVTPEATADPVPLQAPTPPPPSARVAAPTRADAQPVLDRVFEQGVAVDEKTAPAFVAGDFNGDDVGDLAVAVRPRSEDAVARLNAGLMPWRRQDATAPAGQEVRPATVRAADLLLAVVHGAGADAWRSAEAGPGYLVRNAAGPGMKTRPLASEPMAVRVKAFRTHTGDVIVVERGGRPGVVLWTGAAYAWVALPD